MTKYTPDKAARLLLGVNAPQGMEVVSVEYKINFLAAFQGGELRATGKVVRAGKRVIVATAEVIHRDANGKQSPCAVMQQTIMPVPRNGDGHTGHVQ